MHSTASDGTDSPVLLLENVKNSGIRFFSLTDHDTIGGALLIEHLVWEQEDSSIIFIPGVEFSCITEGGKCHILGYDYDSSCRTFLETLEEVEDLRAEKLERRLAFLKKEYGFRLTDEELEQLHSIPSAGKPHIANLMIEKGFTNTRQDAIDNFINKAPSFRTRIPAEEAVSAILAAGGIPVWAHPLGGEGERRITEEEFRRQLDILKGAGLQGMECFYSRYSSEECGFLQSTAAEQGLLISGGSDYHGSNKDIPLGTLNSDNVEIVPEQLTVLEALSE